jgi:hypothetical protein
MACRYDIQPHGLHDGYQPAIQLDYFFAYNHACAED